ALAGTEPGLLGYWQFDEGSGTTIADRSPSAHNGTVINGATWSGAGAADTIPYSLFAQYILDIDLGDTAPPTITSVNLPVEGSSTTFVNPAFTIGFSEDMSMATVTNAVNYELRSAGIDGQFGNGDDQFYTVQCLGYSSGLSANYIITDGPLQPGNYRFTIKTGIQDRSGSPLEAAYIRNFQVTSLAGYVRESRDKAVSLSPTLLSSADGSFGAILSSARGGNNPWDLVVGKIDGDNHLDVITANGGSDNVSVYLGKGDGTFSAPTNFSVGNNPQGIVLGDFNGDPYKDIAVANYSGSKVSIRLGNGDGTFQTNVDFTVASNPHRLITADFNKDGKADLATANYSGDNVTVLLGNGNGTFAAGVNYASGDGTYDLAAADFDNDGNLDIATANWRDGNVAILFGAGNGTFAAPVLYATGSTSRSLVVGKINADNYPDLIALNAGNNTFSVLLNNGLGVFNNFQTYAASTSDPYGLALEDINQDNKLDLVIANYGQSRVTVFQGKGNGEFLPETDYSVGGNPIAVAVGDINEDGRKDIISANYNDGNVSVLVGNATQLLAENPAGSTLRSAFGQGNVDSGDADYFSFSGTAGQLLEVAAETPGNAGNSQLFYEIYTPEGTRLDYFYPNGNGYGQTPRSKNSPLVLPVSGTYYLSVKRSDQYSGEYRFRVSLLDQPAQFEAESNDQINQSNFVLFQQQGNLAAATVAGYISAGDGSGDFYNLGNLSSNATLSVTFKKPGTSDISPKIEVLSSNGTSLAANAAGSTNLDFVIPSAGNYYVKFTSASGTPGIAAQYLLNISLNDTQSPEIASNNLPGEGTISTLIIDRFNVSFSEELQSSTVNSLSNYDLRSSGADGLFNTPDDVIYILSNPGYGSGLQTGFQIVNGPLQPGNYQFKVTGLKDRSGNALVSYLRQFTIENLPGFTLESQNNDVRTNGTPLLMLESPTGVYTVAARGNLTSTADYDYWSFQGYSNALLTVGIDIPGNPNASSLYLRIDNANGSRLYDFNSDYNGFGQSQRILLPEDGMYTVLVRYNHDYQGEYNLKLLQAISPIQLEQESNNTVANATVVNLITNGNSRIGTVAGYIYNNVELDYYNLGTLTNGSTVFLATRTPTGSQFAPQVSLYDANSGYLIEAGSGRAGDGVAEVRITKDGTYYAAVRSGDLRQRVDSAYVLDIQVVPTGSVAFPNLQVTTITPPSGTSIKSGDTIGFNYTVKNVGSVSTTVASWTDSVVISQNTTLGDSDDVQLGIYPHTGVLNDGQEYVQNQSAKIPDGITGTYYVIVQTDFANAVNEFVLEGDNITVSQNSFVIQAAPYPDLVVENLAVSAPVGNVYTISWNTANRGTAPVANPFKERLFVKNTRNNSVLLNIERNVTNAIAAGAVLPQSATITATNAGPHQVLVTTDS
ncbi:MAG: FG-GAP-like repeat-containing protein, partial [Verrucomicrobiota bacterium]